MPVRVLLNQHRAQSIPLTRGRWGKKTKYYGRAEWLIGPRRGLFRRKSPPGPGAFGVRATNPHRKPCSTQAYLHRIRLTCVTKSLTLSVFGLSVFGEEGVPPAAS